MGARLPGKSRNIEVKLKAVITRVVLPGLLLAVTAFFASLLLKGPGYFGWASQASQSPSEPADFRAPTAPIVRTLKPRRQDFPVRITTKGVIDAGRIHDITPLVSGRVSRLTRSLREGALIRKGTRLFEIDPMPINSHVQSLRAELKDIDVQIEGKQQHLALVEQEWELMNMEGRPSKITTGEAKIGALKSRRRALEADLELAYRDIDNSSVRAPFDGIVKSLTLNSKTYLNAGQKVGELHGIAPLRLRVPLSNRQYQRLFFWARAKALSDYRVKVSFSHDAAQTTLRGQITLVEGYFDPDTGKTHVIVEVPQSRTLFERADPPSLLGSFARVEILSPALKEVFVLPFGWEQDGRILLLEEGNRVKARQVVPLFADSDLVVLQEGLQDGETLILDHEHRLQEGGVVTPIPMDETAQKAQSQ